MAAPRFPRCFVSCSLRPEDRPVFDWFRAVLEGMEFEVVHGEVPEPRPPSEKIRDLIRAADIVVAILTQRDKVEGESRWKPPGWVQQEIGMAFEAGKPFAVFVERDVEISGLESAATDYARFDRSDLGEAAPRVVRYLMSVRNQFVGRAMGPEVRAVSKAIQNELARMFSELMAPATFADWTWNLAMLSARTSGRIYLLPEELTAKIDEAYNAFDGLRDALRNEKDRKSPSDLLVNPEARQGSASQGSAPEDLGELKDPKLEERRTDALGKVFVALVELTLNELPPAARANLEKKLAEEAVGEGLRSAPPSAPSPPTSQPPDPPTSASKA